MIIVRHDIKQYQKREVELVEIIDDLRGTLNDMSSEYEKLRKGSTEIGVAGEASRIETLETANRNLNKGFYTREIALQDTIKAKEAEIEKAARQKVVCVEIMKKIAKDLCDVVVGVESGTLGSSPAFMPREAESKFQDTFPMNHDEDIDSTPLTFAGVSSGTNERALYHMSESFFDDDDDVSDESED